MRRLLVLAPASSIHTYHWLRSLGPEWDVLVLSFQASHEKIVELKNVQVEILQTWIPGKMGYVTCVPRIRQVLREWKPDLIHTHYLSSYGIVSLLANQKIPNVLSIWGSDYSQRAQLPVLGLFLKKALLHFSHVLTPSEEFRQQVISDGLLPEQVTVLQYGLDLSKCTFKKSSESGSIFISPRNWNDLYQISAIIKGFQVFLKNHPNSELWLCGGGTQAEIDQIKTLCKNTKEIKIFGKVLQERLFELFSKAHVLVSIPKSDGRPQSVVEGIANGCRPVLSNLRANREIAGDAGVYILSLDPESIAKAFSEALGDWDPSALFKKVIEENDHDTMIKRLLKIYDDVLRAREVSL